eukprot:3864822-Amphidinium_carterae.1
MGPSKEISECFQVCHRCVMMYVPYSANGWLGLMVPTHATHYLTGSLALLFNCVLGLHEPFVLFASLPAKAANATLYLVAWKTQQRRVQRNVLLPIRDLFRACSTADGIVTIVQTMQVVRWTQMHNESVGSDWHFSELRWNMKLMNHVVDGGSVSCPRQRRRESSRQRLVQMSLPASLLRKYRQFSLQYSAYASLELRFHGCKGLTTDP